jgi:hypothetical protein
MDGCSRSFEANIPVTEVGVVDLGPLLEVSGEMNTNEEATEVAH